MGQPKAWLPFGEELLLQRITRIVLAVCSPVVVVAAKGQALPPLPCDVMTVHDERPNSGPLAGLERGMKAMECDRYFLASCDVPLLTKDVIETICTGLMVPFDIAFPIADGRRHPLVGAYRRRLLPSITAALDGGERRMMSFLDQQMSKNIFSSFGNSLRNVNTPAEYAEVLKLAMSSPLIFASQFPTVSDS